MAERLVDILVRTKTSSSHTAATRLVERGEVTICPSPRSGSRAWWRSGRNVKTRCVTVLSPDVKVSRRARVLVGAWRHPRYELRVDRADGHAEWKRFNAFKPDVDPWRKR